MLAAGAGNAALVQALLDKGADPTAEDEFGHTAWQHAVNRSLEEPAFDKAALTLLMQLRFTSFAVINSRRDLHPRECAHAGRT